VLAHFFEHGRWGSLAQAGVDERSLTAEDQLFILMQAGSYLTATRGLGAPEARICYEPAERLCRSLDRPLLLCVALVGQWRYSLMSGKLSMALQIAERVHSLAQEQNNPTLMIEAYRALAVTRYFLADFESGRRYAMLGVQLWRSGKVQAHTEDPYPPAFSCLNHGATSEWHFGETASCQATVSEAIALATELNDLHSLAGVLLWATIIGHFERSPAKVARLASDLIELSTHQNSAFWLAGGEILRGWARSVSGDTAESISWIEDGIEDWRATGSTLMVPYYLGLKAEALHLADRTSEALEAIREAQAMAERSAECWWCAELHRLRGVFLATLGAEEVQIEASLGEAIRIAKEQKSVSLKKRAEATYAEYRRQKASGSGGRGFRLPLW
jgi:predicted ATPase